MPFVLSRSHHVNKNAGVSITVYLFCFLFKPLAFFVYLLSVHFIVSLTILFYFLFYLNVFFSVSFRLFFSFVLYVIYSFFFLVSLSRIILISFGFVSPSLYSAYFQSSFFDAIHYHSLRFKNFSHGDFHRCLSFPSTFHPFAYKLFPSFF